MPDLLKYCLSDKLCPTGVCESTKCLQGLLTKNIYLIAMFNFQVLQTALCPHPPTSKIQIATRQKQVFSEISESRQEAIIENEIGDVWSKQRQRG